MEEFLLRREIPEGIIEEILSQKIDEHVIILMEDDELKKFFPKYGDRMAIKDYCARTCRQGQGSSKRKISLLEKLRLRLSPKNDLSDEENHPPSSPSLRKRKYNSEKDVRMVELGWVNKDYGKKHLQVRAKKGGGTRKMKLPKAYKKADIMKEAIKLFFPNGNNDKGTAEDFEFTILDFKGNELPEDVSINDIIRLTKVKQLRFYLQSTPRITNIVQSRQIASPASELLPKSPQSIACRSPFQNLEIENAPAVFCTDIDPQSVEIDYELEEFYSHPSVEIYNEEPEELDILEEIPQQVHTLTVHRGKIFEEFLKATEYNFFGNTHIRIEMILPNGQSEGGEDFGGVYRDALSEFWSTFYELCTVGTNLKVPYLRHDFRETDWQGIANIFVSGFEAEKYIPIRLAPVFIQSCFGEEVKEEDILGDFSQYLSESEASIVKQSLDDFEKVDMEELLDFLAIHDGKWNPTKENIRQLVRDIAHKELIQKPAFVIKSFGKIFKKSSLSVLEIRHLSEQIKPTVKNCIAKLELQSEQEISSDAVKVYGYLKKFLREADEKTRSLFFRFCTGADILIQNIKIIFIKTAPGMGRVPIAHTCTGVLELPETYENFINFRSELNGILSANIWVMDFI